MNNLKTKLMVSKKEGKNLFLNMNVMEFQAMVLIIYADTFPRGNGVTASYFNNHIFHDKPREFRNADVIINF